MRFRGFFALPILAGALSASCSHPTAPATPPAPPPVVGAGSAGPAAPPTPPVQIPAKPMRQNPLLVASTLFDQAPPFDKIQDTDYKPAILQGMKEQLAEIALITAQTDAPTFDNTLVALEKTGQLYGRASRIFFGLTQANTNDLFQKVEEELAPLIAAHQDAITLDAALFARIKAIYDARKTLKLDPVQLQLVEKTYRDFVKAGALLSDKDKDTLRALNKEESSLQTDFVNKLLAAGKANAVVVSDKAELAGLSDEEIGAAAEAAKARKLDGKWVLPLQNTTQQPPQRSLQNRALREKLFVASSTRTEKGDANDTRAIVQRLAQLRAQRAKLLGFKTFADYQLADQMAKKPATAIKLLNDIARPALAKAKGEVKKMQALIDKQKGGFKLAAWDWQYYAEQVRKAEYDLDESQIKPYFELDRVLQDGVFYAANQLYGLTFKERKDIPVYHPDVRVFEVFDADGSSLALWYCDYFARDNKSGGAWENTFVNQSGLLGTRPVVYNVTNFAKPAPGEKALLSYDDVSTMFHEFGHALHEMFSNVQYPSLAGTQTPRDFVEFPSQFNEHWADEPTVFARYAKHYKTGEPMPKALVDKIKKARTFNQGFATSEYIEASLLDFAWHTVSADAPLQDVLAFETKALAKVSIPEVPPRYRTPYFAHIWGGGYSAGYYAYLWSEVIDDDAFGWFKEHGGMTRANGQRFRDMILSRGGSMDTAEMYRKFRGRDPKVQALLEERGLK
ncbi:MAG: M3 family metallopeptidase [Deltaproteobacteria bacterium]|nr:M3 family metallopeptidase [Deltaproteobacteria bacterium]